VSYVSPIGDLLVDPVPKLYGFAVQYGCRLENGKKPHQVAKCPNVKHKFVQRRHEIMLDTALHHIEGFSPGEISHHIETVKVEPIGDVNGLADSGIELHEELVCVFYHSRLVIA
jgi:hypothetical protein